jgi:hypothetical protein
VFSNTPHTHLFRMFSSSNALNATDDWLESYSTTFFPTAKVVWEDYID